jgi:asparagine N-glycosylation enzyme membrane subunit Stt3
MATKKERAQRLLDSLDSAVRIKKRLWLAIAQGVIISLAVTWLTRWQFGVAASLVFVLLIQLAYERMTNSIAASKLQALNDLGWSTEADSDEQLREKAEKILS